MPIIKVRLEVEYYVKPGVGLDDDESMQFGISEIYNLCDDWINNDNPPYILFEIEDDIDIKGMYFDEEWHA